MAAVVRGFQCATATQETRVESALPFLQTLGRNDGRTRIRRHSEPFLESELGCVQQREFLAEQRLIARLAVRRAQFELAALADQTLEPVGPGETREDVVPLDVTVDAAPLGADACR